MDGVTYDTGALIAADHNDRRMWALHAGFLALEVSPTVPTPVLAEARRGGSRQASLARFLALCTTEALTEQQDNRSRTREQRGIDVVGHDDTFTAVGADHVPRLQRGRRSVLITNDGGDAVAVVVDFDHFVTESTSAAAWPASARRITCGLRGWTDGLLRALGGTPPTLASCSSSVPI
jgi:hypothetical protein